jgi:hypothetical protein
MAYMAVFFAAAVTSGYILVYRTQLGFADNGDSWRVLRSGFVTPPGVKYTYPGNMPHAFPMLQLNKVRYTTFLPLNLSGLMVSVVALFSKAAGSTDLYMLPISSIYFLAYYAGSYLLVRSTTSFPARAGILMICAIVLLDPVLVSYFNSAYEEASVLALFPLFIYAAAAAFLREKHMYLLLASALSIVLGKSVMIVVLVVPLVFCLRRRPRYLRGFALIVCICLLIFFKSARYMEQANSFNRLYNGVAYSVSGVEHWRAHNFLDRRTLAPSLVKDTVLTPLGMPSGAEKVWGHSYWPDVRIESQGAMAAYANLGRAPNYLRLLLRHPSLPVTISSESFVTAVRADYSLCYLSQRCTDESFTPYGRALLAVQRHLGLTFVLAFILFVGAVIRKRAFIASVSFVSMIAPLVVVMGDGYYEFEKHLVPFAVLTCFSLCCAILSTNPLPYQRLNAEEPVSTTIHADDPPAQIVLG